MEFWFIFVILSAIFTGFQVFTYKVAAERDYDVPLINVYAGLISTVFLFAGAVYFAENFSLSLYIFSLMVVTAFLYMTSNITRHLSLQSIDTAIFFPLYKVVGPLLVIVAGVALFAENFSSREWIGLVLSLLVPIFLISRIENVRQKNLLRGIKFLLVTTIITVIAAVLSKEMATKTENIWFLIAVGDFFLAIMAMILFWKQSNGENVVQRARVRTDKPMLVVAFWMGILQAFGFAFLMLAYRDGPIGIVYTVQSLYILIPIVLSIIYYNEHWNARKVIAIVLSIAALALLK